MLVFRNIDREYHGLQILDRWMKVVQDFTPVNIFLLLPLFTQTNVGRRYFYFLKKCRPMCMQRNSEPLAIVKITFQSTFKKSSSFQSTFKNKALTTISYKIVCAHLTFGNRGNKRREEKRYWEEKRFQLDQSRYLVLQYHR